MVVRASSTSVVRRRCPRRTAGSPGSHRLLAAPAKPCSGGSCLAAHATSLRGSETANRAATALRASRRRAVDQARQSCSSRLIPPGVGGGARGSPALARKLLDLGRPTAGAPSGRRLSRPSGVNPRQHVMFEPAEASRPRKLERWRDEVLVLLIGRAGADRRRRLADQRRQLLDEEDPRKSWRLRRTGGVCRASERFRCSAPDEG